ncbi:hypothetical protein TNCV_1032881 [Trichonephila clavipes]|nr:hypothetical protein TNCV_1032881 [Trichonephila clavipes]
MQEKNNSTRQHERNNSIGENNSTQQHERNNSIWQQKRNNSTQQKKTTQLSRKKQLNSSVGTKQLNSAMPSTAFTAESAFSTYLRRHDIGVIFNTYLKPHCSDHIL